MFGGLFGRLHRPRHGAHPVGRSVGTAAPGSLRGDKGTEDGYNSRAVRDQLRD